MFADDFGLDSLSPMMKVRVQAELAAGEQLVWAGRARRLAPPARWEVGALFLVAAVVVAGLLMGVGMGGTFVASCLVAGLCTLYLVLRKPPQGEGSFYALTDRRAILWLAARPAGSYQVRSFRPREMNTLFRIEHPDDSGDLIFHELPLPPGLWWVLFGETGTYQLGFKRIGHVRRVEELLRRVLLEPHHESPAPRWSFTEESPRSEEIQAQLPPLSPRWGSSDDPVPPG
jgi:hypothetical protein